MIAWMQYCLIQFKTGAYDTLQWHCNSPLDAVFTFHFRYLLRGVYILLGYNKGKGIDFKLKFNFQN